MDFEYEIELIEDTIQLGNRGNVIHHPLNGPFRSPKGGDRGSYGHLSFAGHNLDESLLLDGVKVFYLMLHKEIERNADLEEWVDPLHANILQRLGGEDQSWYIGLHTYSLPSSSDSSEFITLEESLERHQFGGKPIKNTIVESEKPFRQGYGFIDKLFFEVPTTYIQQTIRKYWPYAIQGIPIEGYLYESGNINLIREWNRETKDDKLFRKVINRASLAFYTFPSENRHFAFVTNKLSMDDFNSILDINELQTKA